MITLVINGQEIELAESITVATYVASLGFDSRYIAVARNGDVVERDAFEVVTLCQGDRVEIVRPVGGG